MDEHEMKCLKCGQIMDLRNLSQVFAHEECNGKPVDYNTIEDIQYSGSMKVGEPFYYAKNHGKSISTN